MQTAGIIVVSVFGAAILFIIWAMGPSLFSSKGSNMRFNLGSRGGGRRRRRRRLRKP